MIWGNVAPSGKGPKPLRLEIKSPPGYERLSGNDKLRTAIANALAKAPLPEYYQPLVEELLAVDRPTWTANKWREEKRTKIPFVNMAIVTVCLHRQENSILTIGGFKLSNLPSGLYRMKNCIYFDRPLEITVPYETQQRWWYAIKGKNNPAA